MAKTTYTLFMAKEDLGNFADYFTDNAKNKVGTAHCQSYSVGTVVEGSTLYVFSGDVPAPVWLRALQRKIPEIELFQRRSAAGVFFFHAGGKVFSVTFAHGWMYLDDSKFESNFGLKVAVNSLDPSKLKRLERSNLGDALQGVAQSPFQRAFDSFGVDDALDLVKKLSGSTAENSPFESVTGARSLKITGEFELEDLPDLATAAAELFSADNYKNTTFAIIDSVEPIIDSTLETELFQDAVDEIKAGSNCFEIALAGTSEAEGVGFKFSGTNMRRTYPDLLLRHYTQDLGDRLNSLEVETLSKHSIVAHFDDDRPPSRLTIRRALVGSIVKNGAQYAINDGQWYRIDDTFRQSVETAFTHGTRHWDVQRPSPPRKIYDDLKNGRIESEGEYNIRIAQELGLACLDAKLLQIPDVTRSAFEVCDLLDVERKRFIHVKKSSRRSSVLSHFFKQGSNSAQHFKKVPSTWDKLCEILDAEGYGGESQALRAQREAGDFGGWTVEFWIADAPRQDGTFNIPFFSKITLKDEFLGLRAMEFEVVLRFIGITPDQIT